MLNVNNKSVKNIQLFLITAMIVIFGIVYMVGNTTNFSFEEGMFFQYVIIPSTTLSSIVMALAVNHRSKLDRKINVLPLGVLGSALIYAQTTMGGGGLLVFAVPFLVYPFVLGVKDTLPQSRQQ